MAQTIQGHSAHPAVWTSAGPSPALETTDAADALDLEGLALAIELVRIAATEAEGEAPAEAIELRRTLNRLRYHLDGVKHVHDVGGAPELWIADEVAA